ncbi:helix-turn-helix domain-containing protein, partial [Streptomyces calidiresistens]|uniref:helix-turn-helix domain-containing protein n=1 Tax=Streptomyces calidiresistens TaxID=1485586 RepID=UPI003F691856
MPKSPEIRSRVSGHGWSLRPAGSRDLADLSETTGISVSTLSRLESGQRKPTLE